MVEALSCCSAFLSASCGRVLLQRSLRKLGRNQKIWDATAGWWWSCPSEKYESQLGSLFPIYYGKTKIVPNHQSIWDATVIFH